MIWSTQVKAICPITKYLLTFQGPCVPGDTIEQASEFCQNNGLGYLEIIGRYVETVDY